MGFHSPHFSLKMRFLALRALLLSGRPPPSPHQCFLEGPLALWAGPVFMVWDSAGRGWGDPVLTHQAEGVGSAQTVSSSVHSALASLGRFLFQAPHCICHVGWSPPVRDSPSVLVFPALTFAEDAGRLFHGASSAGLRLESLHGCGETVAEPYFRHHRHSATLAVTEPSVAPRIVQGWSPPVTSSFRPYDLHSIQKTKENRQRTCGWICDRRQMVLDVLVVGRAPSRGYGGQACAVGWTVWKHQEV